MVGHVENLVNGLVGEDQTTFQHGGGPCTCDGCVDGQRSGMVERGVFGQVDETVEDHPVVGNIARLTVLDDDVVHAGSRRRAGEAREGEGPVGVGDVLVEEDFLGSARAGDEFGIGHGRQVGEDTNVLNRRSVGHVTKLSGDRDGVRSIAGHRHRGNGLIDDFNFLGWWTGVKRNPTKIGVAVGTVLLKPDFRPGRSIGGVDGVAITRPRAADVAGDLASGQACQSSHRDEGRVEFTAGPFFERFQDVERDVNRTDGSGAVEITFELGRAVAVDDEILQCQRCAVGIGGPGVGDDASGDVPHVGVFGGRVGEPRVHQQFVGETLTRYGGGRQRGPVEIVLRLLEDDLVDRALNEVQDVGVVGTGKVRRGFEVKRDVGVP